MPVTQQDIADRLNLSRSLIGGVLSNHPNLRASKVTRQRIIQAAEEMGYRPNSVASNLRRGKTGVVALVYRQDLYESSDRELGPVMSSLAAGMSGLDYELLIRPYLSHESLLEGLNEIASRSQCDAIVLWVEHGGEAAAELLESLKFPFVIKGRHEARHPNWPQADFDHEALMLIAVDHLVAAGHRRIGYIGSESIEDYSYCLQKGYAAAMNDMGLDPQRWRLTVPDRPDVVDQAMRKWLHLPDDQQPTAMVIGAYLSAWDGLEIALAREGRRLGLAQGDFAAVGGRRSLPLLFGDAMAYDQIELSDIVDGVIGLLQPLLTSQNVLVDRIVRLIPQLHHQPSLRLPLGNFESYRSPSWPAR